jgi:hypothetical protein
MALTVPGPAFAPGFDATLIDEDDWILSAAAQSGSVAAWAMLRGPLRGVPGFRARAKTTDNTAASNALDLTTLGLTFKAGGFRRVFFRSTAVTDNDSWTQEWEQVVWGNDGTTPKLLGNPRLLMARGEINGTVVDYGQCTVRGTYSTDTVTSDTDDCSAGSSLGNNSTNTITLTHPIARSTPKRITGFNNSPATATASGARHLAGITATSTTFSLFVTDLATPSAASPAPTDLTVDFFILPPPSIALVMSTNNVQVHVGHDATDDVYHDIEVWVTRQDIHSHVAD